MNLAYRFPIIFWNCACLISDAGGAADPDEDNDDVAFDAPIEQYSNEMDEFTDDDSDENVNDSYDEDEDCDGYPVEVKVMNTGKKKKKAKATNFGKIAEAIGRLKMAGIKIESPDINSSSFTFSPDVSHNTVRYGLSGITRINETLIGEIIAGRPYKSLEDFTNRIKVNKPQMISLIKSGAFDSFGDRRAIMRQYAYSISDTKKRVTLQNLNMLIDFGLIPDEYDLPRRVYKFDKYLKKFKLDSEFYGLDAIAFNFYSTNFDIDKLICDAATESGFKIRQTVWATIYQSMMDKIRPYVKNHSNELLEAINSRLMQETWNKYCLGSINKWEMDSISCYVSEHELSQIDNYSYGIVDFFNLSENPEIDRILPIKGKTVPIYHINRIAGTVLDRNKNKRTVTLLTTSGVVTVRIFGNGFANYDKQISERDAAGKKHVIRKSEFSRGNKIIVCGIREGESFRAKKYKSTPFHLIETIESVNEDGTITTYSRDDE